jgi:hypothetical protein
LGVSESATFDDVSKALKKKSRILHPDKAKHSFIASRSTPRPKKPGEKRKPGIHASKGPSEREVQRFVKGASERYSRLGVIANILKGPARERYDYFLSHGFPKWRGTGYYYTRYRPGLGTVLIGLFLIGGGAAHYFALRITYNNQRALMEKYRKNARKQAWGDESALGGIPGLGAPVEVAPPGEEEPDLLTHLNRRQRREYEKQSKKEKPSKTKPAKVVPAPAASTTEERRRVTAENGKVFIVTRSGDVYLEEVDEDGEKQEFLLNPNDIAKPTIWDTAVIRLPIWAYRKLADPFLKDTKPIAELDGQSTSIGEAFAEVVAEVTPNAVNPEKVSASEKMSSSMMSDFEIVDSTGIDSDAAMNGAGAKKRAKKAKK